MDWGIWDIFGVTCCCLTVWFVVDYFTGISGLWGSADFDLKPVECDSPGDVDRLRGCNAHVFTSWNEFRGFIATHYPDMDEDDIDDFQEQWREAVLGRTPGKHLCFVVTECGGAPIRPETA